MAVTLTVCEPHDDENVTLPSDFFIVMVKVAELPPVTLADDGETCICPLLLGVAVMVAVPLKFAKCTLTVPSPLLTIVIALGLA